MVVGMVDLLRRTLGEMVQIETRLGEAVPVIMADPGQIENALLNLSINARDAMPEGGTLVIETVLVTVSGEIGEIASGTYVRLTVSDTGVGMPPQVRQRAFEPFFTTKGPGAGSGLGLSMVYGFVKQSGGHVELHSRPGEGTRIGIYLPVRDEDLVAVEEPAAAEDLASEAGRLILVVEDDPRVRKVAVRRLHTLGHRVLEADNGLAALAILDTGQPVDVLFSDVVMAGGMSGVALAAKARELRPHLQIVLTSGYTDPGGTDAGGRPVARQAVHPAGPRGGVAAGGLLTDRVQPGRTTAANR